MMIMLMMIEVFHYFQNMQYIVCLFAVLIAVLYTSYSLFLNHFLSLQPKPIDKTNHNWKQKRKQI